MKQAGFSISHPQNFNSQKIRNMSKIMCKMTPFELYISRELQYVHTFDVKMIYQSLRRDNLEVNHEKPS